MNPTDTVNLLRLVGEIWPSMRINPHTPDAWHPLLQDIPRDAAITAVRRLAMVSSSYLAPADIRREVASAAGLLPPGEDTAWELALAVAVDEGYGRSTLPGAVRATYDALGGAPSIRNGLPGPTRAQFGQAYRRIAEDLERSVLGSDLGEGLELRALVRGAS
jgi:hypothetical protein